ncbi:MAG: DUF445 domain-containing protein [Acidobacteriota bacterium]|nr:DUF445 domain-containing protein [Acidobacteriota bacterium]
MNKSLVVNVACLLMIGIGYAPFTPGIIRPHVLSMGLFGFSGAITNWLAIHMLFERVPGLYGSGIIPLKFEAFKSAIRNMIMNQFFTMENIRKFTHNDEGFKPDLKPIVEHLDYDMIFNGFVEVVLNSKFGSMLNMFGGKAALEGMREPFATTLKSKLGEMAEQPHFLENITHNATDDLHHVWKDKISGMVDNRLDELTPQMVKEIIQEMIRSHLGWLVIWGGVFGSVIGLISSFIN